MKNSTNIAWILLVLFMVSLNPIQAQEDKKKPDPKPTKETLAALQKTIDGLKLALKEKVPADFVHFAKELPQTYKGGDDKLKGHAVKAVAMGLKSKNDEIRDLAVDTLGLTGGSAYKTLLKETKSSTAKKDVAYLCRVIRAVGKLAEPKSVDALLKFMNSPDNDVIAQAVSALGDFPKAKTKVRKQIVEGLLKYYSPLESAANKSGAKTSDKEKYGKLRGNYESTLKILTGQTITGGAPEWSRWFRKEGKKKKEW